MTKISKQLSKMAFSFAILLGSFEGEGRAQLWIEQQCAVNCINTFNSTFVTCMSQKPPTTCIQAAVTALIGSTSPNGIGQTFPVPPDVCPPNSSSSALTATIDQQCAINCANTFNTSYTACAGSISCIAPLIGALSKCITSISPNQACAVTAFPKERARR